MSARTRSILVGLLGVFLLVLPATIVAYKISRLGYRLGDILPQSRQRVTYVLELDGHGREVSIRTYLPATDLRQEITDEENVSGQLHFSSQQDGVGRSAVWSGSATSDRTQLRYSFDVDSRAVSFAIDPHLSVPPAYPDALREDLRATPSIQVDSAEIAAKLRAIGADEGPAMARLRRIFDATRALTPRAFKGTTDALSALRLGEASCNGKSRLFVALARATGIPARLVGGLILEPGAKRTSHQWVEAYVGDHWVPFCPTNDHFAELPARYLVLYRGDEALFKHTADINFDYRFEVASHQVPSPKAKEGLAAVNVWALFDRLGLPFTLLRIVLMLPIGALVVVVFRNVVGLPTFGTFLPALVATAMLQTGAAWGIVALLIIVVVVALARFALEALNLLHSPTLAILLACVTLTMLATSLLADRFGLTSLTRVSLFPIAVLAITAERFYVSISDNGVRDALRELGGTIVVILACYSLMTSLALESIIMGFPEVLLVVMAINLYLGTWTGLRLTEYFRFRRLLGAT